MSRSVTILAWIVATAISVGVSTAAVGEVRDQVSQRPALVSLATLRQATTTTTTVPPVREENFVVFPPTFPESSTTVETTTTTSTTTTTPPTTAPATTAKPPPAPVTASHSIEAGSVTVRWNGDALDVVDVTPADGYDDEPWGSTADRTVIGFVGSDQMWAVVAEFHDGTIDFFVWGPRHLDGSEWDDSVDRSGGGWDDGSGGQDDGSDWDDGSGWDGGSGGQDDGGGWDGGSGGQDDGGGWDGGRGGHDGGGWDDGGDQGGGDPGWDDGSAGG